MYLTLLPTWRAYAEADAKWREAYAKWREAYVKWREAVRTVCGPNAQIEWTDEGCIVLGVMVFLHKINA